MPIFLANGDGLESGCNQPRYSHRQWMGHLGYMSDLALTSLFLGRLMNGDKGGCTLTGGYDVGRCSSSVTVHVVGCSSPLLG